ncbi:Yos1 protein [Saccharomycopsis crataegensis]|uniref:Yos1 protein n=1 Tax=Saccharomycopsis crataegensis TaxID=43959 RepID=A0AAV5QIX9_9ASCO|nr:Yos1 protein [Saccharomycopsis crataegensis]
MMGLGKLLYVVVLLVNAVAVLSEDRFLNRIGWGSSGKQFQNDVSVKGRMINLISATRTLLRIPLILVNVIIILYELILG